VEEKRGARQRGCRTFLDPELSGYRRNRPALKQLLEKCRAGEIDIVICEAIDRIARDAEDLAWLGKKLSYHRISFWTLHEGEVDETKIAIAAMFGTMFLSSLKQKTHRGLLSVVQKGRAGGGRCYGYRKVPTLDGAGNEINGIFEIHECEAAVVRRIYDEFAAGRSGVDIATRLNAEGVASPRGGEWGSSTIRGDPKRFTGILSNPLYRGVRIWNRREWRKDPDSDERERRYRMRAEEEWSIQPAPKLRIVSEETAAAVEAELAKRANPATGKLVDSRRQKHLLSGLLKCGDCGGNYTLAGKDYYRCARNRDRGTCQNGKSIRLGIIETHVLRALENQLLTDDLAKAFVDEFRKEMARLAKSDTSDRAAIESRLKQVAVEIENLSRNFLRGVVSDHLVGMLKKLEAEERTLKKKLEASPSKAVATIITPHPRIVELYQTKVRDLRVALADSEARTEAIPIIQSLIHRVVVKPGEGEFHVAVEAHGAQLLAFALKTKNPRRGGDCSVKVVAGVGFEPTTFRL
jgi:site-specific DNA recombinase